MPPSEPSSKSERVHVMRTYAPMPFFTLYDGAQVQTYGSAVKDGDFYMFGKREGRVLSVEHQTGSWIYVTYLQATS